MLIRIVRMYFKEEGVDLFLAIFKQHKEQIRHFSGCSHLQLLKDPSAPYCYTTLSHWDQARSLENYRQSSLFTIVWTQVKPLFSEKPTAFSLEKFIEVK